MRIGFRYGFCSQETDPSEVQLNRALELLAERHKNMAYRPPRTAATGAKRTKPASTTKRSAKPALETQPEKPPASTTDETAKPNARKASKTAAAKPATKAGRAKGKPATASAAKTRKTAGGICLIFLHLPMFLLMFHFSYCTACMRTRAEHSPELMNVFSRAYACN